MIYNWITNAKLLSVCHCETVVLAWFFASTTVEAISRLLEKSSKSMPDYPMFDKTRILAQIQRFRSSGESAIRASGIEVDELLAKEVASPGTDQRFGVNIITRPSPAVITEIKRLQNHLHALEPDQYYYPAQDLHATILEIAFCIPMPEVIQLVERINQSLPTLMQGLPSPVLEVVCLGFDPKGCALSFVPRDTALQELRAELKSRLESLGLQLMSRYLLTAAHVSLFRYIQPLETEKNQWADYLAGTLVDPRLTWEISSLYVTYGAIWYSSHTRIQSIGPLALGY